MWRSCITGFVPPTSPLLVEAAFLLLVSSRISIPYFLNPGLDAQIPVLDLPADLAARSRGVELDPDNPIFNTYGENAWKSRTRAHPDVAELHHGIRAANVPSVG